MRKPRPKSKYFQDVIDFHKKFGINYDGPPRQSLPLALRVFRKQRLIDECDEYIVAYQESNSEMMLDALCDIIYIALGTAHLHGWDFDEAWQRVHDANMRKEKVSKKNPSRYSIKCDIVKPKDWVGPSHADLIGPTETNHEHLEYAPPADE